MIDLDRTAVEPAGRLSSAQVELDIESEDLVHFGTSTESTVQVPTRGSTSASAEREPCHPLWASWWVREPSTAASSTVWVLEALR